MTSSVALLRFKYLAWFGWLLSNSNSVMHYWWGLNSVRLLTGSSRSIEASINSVVMSVMTSSLVMEATSFIWGNIFVFLSENRLSMIVTSSQSHREQLISMLELIGAVIFCTGGLLFTFCLLFVTSEDSERCYGDEESRRFQVTSITRPHLLLMRLIKHSAIGCSLLLRHTKEIYYRNVFWLAQILMTSRRWRTALTHHRHLVEVILPFQPSSR